MIKKLNFFLCHKFRKNSENGRKIDYKLRIIYILEKKIINFWMKKEGRVMYALEHSNEYRSIECLTHTIGRIIFTRSPLFQTFCNTRFPFKF